jgi:hypothetical protein
MYAHHLSVTLPSRKTMNQSFFFAATIVQQSPNTKEAAGPSWS